jgi:cysteine peptidase B
LKKAAELQAKNPKATFGVTKFSDLTDEEHKQYFRMASADFSKFPTLPVKKDFTGSRSQLSCSPDPTNFDWFADCSGSCTEVYNQGQCGSCWAFSATETIESYYALDTGAQIVSLSMEQIVDCDTAGQGMLRIYELADVEIRIFVWMCS